MGTAAWKKGGDFARPFGLGGRSGNRVRRLGGDRAGEIRLTRFPRNPSVSPGEMAARAAERLGPRCLDRHVLAIQDTAVVESSGGGGFICVFARRWTRTTGRCWAWRMRGSSSARKAARLKGAACGPSPRKADAGWTGRTKPREPARTRARSRSSRIARATFTRLRAASGAGAYRKLHPVGARRRIGGCFLIWETCSI